MAKRPGIFVCAIFLFLATLTASHAVITYTDLHVTVRDIVTNSIVTSQPVEIAFYNANTGTTINLTDFINQEGLFDYRLNIGNWKLVVTLNRPETPEIDYSAERTFLIEENNPEADETIYLTPVGSVEGNVVYPSGKLISNADITFKCGSYKASAKTDQYGSFKQNLLPIGQCKVQAAFDEFVGSSLVNVSHGELSSVVVRLDKTLLSTTKNYLYLLIGVVLVAALVFLVYRITKKASKTKKKEKSKPAKKRKSVKGVPVKKAEKPEEEELNPRARDIMKTLNEKEKKIVDFILVQKGYKSTQATIRNNTGIPKTTLARLFQSLEAKKVINIDVVGKLKKIELTAWFLGKE